MKDKELRRELEKIKLEHEKRISRIEYEYKNRISKIEDEVFGRPEKIFLYGTLEAKPGLRKLVNMLLDKLGYKYIDETVEPAKLIKEAKKG